MKDLIGTSGNKPATAATIVVANPMTEESSEVSGFARDPHYFFGLQATSVMVVACPGIDPLQRSPAYHEIKKNRGLINGTCSACTGTFCTR